MDQDPHERLRHLMAERARLERSLRRWERVMWVLNPVMIVMTASSLLTALYWRQSWSVLLSLVALVYWLTMTGRVRRL